MILRRSGSTMLTAAGLALGLAHAASAQPVGDPIGAALEAPVSPAAPPVPPPAAAPAAPAIDEETAETMAAPPPTAAAPVPPPPAAPLPVPPAPAPPAQIAPAPVQPAPVPQAPTPPAAVPSPPAPPAPQPPAAPQSYAPYSPFPTSPPPGVTYARPPQTYAPPPSAYVRPAPPSVHEPVHIGETNRTPDRPLSVYDMNYDARLRASSASAQGMLGPLDGSWTLNVPGVGDIYVLELVDRGVGPLEGAWRDLRRIGAIGASGFVDDIQRYGSTLTVRFSPGERLGVATATLNAQPDGKWTGELSERGERRTAILRRN